jgi:hypothetical protein
MRDISRFLFSSLPLGESGAVSLVLRPPPPPPSHEGNILPPVGSVQYVIFAGSTCGVAKDFGTLRKVRGSAV